MFLYNLLSVSNLQVARTLIVSVVVIVVALISLSLHLSTHSARFSFWWSYCSYCNSNTVTNPGCCSRNSSHITIIVVLQEKEKGKL